MYDFAQPDPVSVVASAMVDVVTVSVCLRKINQVLDSVNQDAPFSLPNVKDVDTFICIGTTTN